MRTDQLDGETDWKLRVAVPSCQGLPSNDVRLVSVKEVLVSFGLMCCTCPTGVVQDGWLCVC